MMPEAGRKDDALFKLMESVRGESGLTVLFQASFEL